MDVEVLKESDLNLAESILPSVQKSVEDAEIKLQNAKYTLDSIKMLIALGKSKFGEPKDGY